MKPLIADIKRNSLDDGPGIRTVIFFKGCPLSCVWCQNPETQSTEQEIVFESDQCLGCGDCEAACTRDALDLQRDYPVDRSLCDLCGNCISACRGGALQIVGREYNKEELLDLILKDEVFYRNSGGGVTLSGGEPAIHAGYLGSLLPELKDRGIHICMETCGQYNCKLFEDHMLPWLDLVYFDMKLADPDLHRKYCGVSNELIRANFESLIQRTEIQTIPRIPLIPNITATEENLSGIRLYLESLNLYNVELLPYNPLWISKAASLGFTPEYTYGEWLSPEERAHAREVFTGFTLNDF